MIKRLAAAAFLVIVAVLIVRLAGELDWPRAVAALRALPVSTFLAALALAAASHAVYSSYDLIGRQQTRHRVSAPRTAGIAFVSYAFNLNFGSLVGALAMRYRLYSRNRLGVGETARVVALSIATNWLGYALLLGTLLAWHPPPLPESWPVGSAGMRLAGVGLLLAGGAYLAICVHGRHRLWRWRGHAMRLPPGHIALLQAAISTVNWMLIGAVCWVLLQRQVDYPAVLVTLLLAAVAGVVTHVPGGLGVVEGTFLLMLSHRVDQAPLLAALLAYRALYYLLPLLVAGVLFFVVDRPAVQPATASGSAGG